MKVMSIIGIVWFSISLLCVLAFINSDLDASAGWGLLGVLYALPYSIVGLISSQKNNDSSDLLKKLASLNELKEKGILTEEEFSENKRKILG